MKNFTQKDINALFSRLCCSRCRNEFTKESFNILEQNNDILICRLFCEKCGKDFGEIVFNYNRKAGEHSALEILEGPPPINYDDILNAHKFIKENL